MTASILKQDETTQNVKKQQQLILVRRYSVSVTEQNKFPLQAPFSGQETDR